MALMAVLVGLLLPCAAPQDSAECRFDSYTIGEVCMAKFGLYSFEWLCLSKFIFCNELSGDGRWGATRN